MPGRTRRNGYRGEPSHEAKFTPLLPKQRLCLVKTDDGYCLEPREHPGKHKPWKGTKG